MKKLTFLLSLLLVFSLVLSPAASAAGDNYDTLADWDIRIAVPDSAAAAVLKGNTYYIYAQNEGYIPYVMLMATSRFASEEDYIEYMNGYMAEQYAEQGFAVASEARQKQIGNKTVWEVDYAYQISGLDTSDRRIFITVGDLTYMFACKEIASQGWTVGTMLEDVVADCVFLSQPAETPAPAPVPDEGGSEDDWNGVYDAYLYRQDDGMPKYWLDFTNSVIDNPVLHCYFRGSDPNFYETYYILDFSTADLDGNICHFHNICDSHGFDISHWFRTFDLEFYSDCVVMAIERDENTLAGGSENILFSDRYMMEPVTAEVRYEYHDENGELKYWLVPNGEDIELHGMFRSGDPEVYEDVYVLDGESAEWNGDYVVSFSKVTKQGSDVSRWFQSIVLSRVQTSFLLSVKRDESTLAGGAGDNILTGIYTFDAHVSFGPLGYGPFDPDELTLLAQQYYFKQTGFFPPEADIEENEDGSFTVHLYEIVDLDGWSHTATSAWYTVDAFGVGVNEITGEEVYLA